MYPVKYSIKQKIDLANGVIAEYCGDEKSPGWNAPMFKHLRKMERKYNKNPGRYDLSDFCLKLSELPEKHFRLMRAINWLDDFTDAPLPHLKGFYKEKYSKLQGITEIEHYITVSQYVYLLFVELSVINLYEDDIAS